MNVSVVLPAYNNAQTIASVLEALKNQEYSKGQVEVIVIDDGSTDSTAEICKAHGVRLVQNEQNSGLGYSLNKGITLSNHEIIVTLHGDTVPLSKTWLSELLEPFTDASIAASCSLQQPPDHLSNRLCLWEKLLWAKLDEHNAFNDKADAYRKDVLSELGCFDYKTFRTAGEDEDLALRLRQSNKKIAATNAKVLHDHYQSYTSSFECLKKLLRKEYTFGRAGGALRRKFPFHNLGSYIPPRPKSFVNDGLFRTIVCIGCFIPYVQVVCIPILVLLSLPGILKTVRKIRMRSALLLYPLFNIMRYMSYTLGYCVGTVTKKQR